MAGIIFEMNAGELIDWVMKNGLFMAYLYYVFPKRLEEVGVELK